jgi:outer membrane protein OmpA-like peptidoglycan-associated protein
VQDPYSNYTHFYKFNDKGLVITDSSSEGQHYIYRFRYEYYGGENFNPMKGQTIIFQNIFFDVNKFDLLPESFMELDKLVNYLQENSTATIEISGHTDNTGNEDSNKSLSTMRAKAIRDYMVLENIEGSRISYKGYGSSKPIADNTTEEGKRKNRRVEFIIR